MAGSCAIGGRESCQVLTEAALSGYADVPRESLAGAACRIDRPEVCTVEERVRGIQKKPDKGFFCLPLPPESSKWRGRSP